MSFIKLNQKSVDILFVILIATLIAIVATLHYSTPVHLHHWHELFRLFFYVPIIFAAFRFRVRGGVITAIAIIVVYYPHIAFQWGGSFFDNFSRFLQMAMYVIIGLVTGILAEREYREQRRYQQTAEELHVSYQKLQQQSEQMAEMEDQLRHSERLSILGELSASLAHEVRNPLGSIWGVVEILQDKCKDVHENNEFMAILMKEVKRLNGVVENYLALAKKSQISVTDCNLAEVIRSVVMLLNHKARKAGVHLETRFAADNVIIHADEGQLRQVLINLILNAIAAIENQGEVAIAVATDETQQSAHLSIVDTGVGIPADKLNTIFNPFYTTRSNGTGLGLSIVKRIADQYKWQLGVKSTINAGTTVELKIPIIQGSYDENI